jgi:hypothetical protein
VATKESVASALRFSDEESFGLFMEGLRFLQLYEDETSREQPRKSVLDRRMQDALDRLRRCVFQYSYDPLPRFYFGVALAMRNQEVYVTRLLGVSTACVALGRYLGFRDLSQASALSVAERKDAGERSTRELQDARAFRELELTPWPLLEEASRMFRSLIVAQDSTLLPLSLPFDPPSELAVNDPDLLLVAKYNLAQIYGRRGGREFLQLGLDALDPDNQASDFHQEQSRSVTSKTTRAPVTISGTNKVELERAATALQCNCLRESLKVRLLMFRNPKKEIFQAAFKKFQDIGVRIEQSVRDLAFKADLKADFFTKEGYIYCEQALNRALTDPSLSAERCLILAAERFNAALELKDHWNPAQIYLGLVRRIQSGIAEAYIEWKQHKKQTAFAGIDREKSNLQHEIDEIADSQLRLPGETSAQWRDRVKSSQDLEVRRVGILDRLARIDEQKDTFEQSIKESQEEQKQFARDADRLFALLQGLPWPPPPEPPKYGDG